VALAVAAEGARVALLGRTLSKCEAVVAEIDGRGGVAMALECDVEHRSQIEASVERTVGAWGRIDPLVNNAQTKVYRSLRRMTDDEMETVSSHRDAPPNPLPPRVGYGVNTCRPGGHRVTREHHH